MLFLSQDGQYTAVPLPDRLQALTIQDIFLDGDQGKIYYIGSNQELVAVQSNALSAKGGMLSEFDAATQTFKGDNWFGLPTGINVRALVRLENGKGLIITNDDYPFLVDLP